MKETMICNRTDCDKEATHFRTYRGSSYWADGDLRYFVCDDHTRTTDKPIKFSTDQPKTMQEEIKGIRHGVIDAIAKNFKDILDQIGPEEARRFLKLVDETNEACKDKLRKMEAKN